VTNPIEVLQAEAKSCDRCHGERLLYVDGENRAYPLFQKAPPFPVRVVVVAEAPNYDDSFNEAKRRLTLDPDTDPSGAFMHELLDSVGLGPDQVLFTNSVLCLPAEKSDGKHPVSARQQDLCCGWLAKFIDTANPAVVVTFGGAALQALRRLEHHGLTLSQGAGKLHPWRGRRLLPLYHPGRLGRIARPEAEQRKDIAVLREILDGGDRVGPAAAQEMMKGHPDGARLVLRSAVGEVGQDLACSIGLRWGSSPVFAYLSPRNDGPPFWSEARFFVERLSRRADAWVIECRDERGVRQIEVQPLADGERAAVRRWMESMPAEVLVGAENAMRSMLDPRAL